MDDTIIGISTAQGIGAISIIRVSGEKAIELVDSIFSANLSKKETHTITYGKILTNEEIIDEVLVSLMRSPKSYTTEDVVEINCHGSIASTKKIMELLLEKGARLAEPGEFTKRAFLKGRIKLNEAEGVMDLINSSTELERKIAINRVDGRVTTLVRNLRETILKILGNIEVNIDFPEYQDIEVYTLDLIKNDLLIFKKDIDKIIKETKDYKIVSEGIKTLILGKPNVGKSSLLNYLLQEEKAIVTDIPGTTRDIVEGKINLGGFTLNLLDTAGVRTTDDVVEKIGVDKSINLINEADLILLVLDASKQLSEEDKELLNLTQTKNRIVIFNKKDIKIEQPELNGEKTIEISVLQNQGIDNLKEEIGTLLEFEKIKQLNPVYIANSRELHLLNQIKETIKNIERAIEDKTPIDLIEIDIKKIWQILGNLIGENYDSELIDSLFTNFCLGK